MANATFSKVSGLRPRRNAFDLSYSSLGTAYFMRLIPVYLEEVVPHDTFKIGCEMIIRFQPLVAPILHEINATVHYFFVPYRLLTGWTRNTSGIKVPIFDWEAFITGGTTGGNTTPLPRWIHTAAANTIGSLWDYMGFPIIPSAQGPTLPDVNPVIFPQWAYNLIYAEYYVDQNLTTISTNNTGNMIQPDWNNNFPVFRAFKKDYFTSALPWQQRGSIPALPLRGVNEVGYYSSDLKDFYSQVTAYNPPTTLNLNVNLPAPMATPQVGRLAANMANAATFNISDLRLSTQLQKWLERNSRAGSRYTEFLKSHFGVAPTDARLDRPEYIGGIKSPIIISEVLQTSKSEANAPQANMAGHGLNASSTYVGSYHAQEFGLIMGLLSVMPKASYHQGIRRQWLRYSRFDYYFPEFAHLSEQGIYRAELYWEGHHLQDATSTRFSGLTYDSQIFGFTGRYDEMRTAFDTVVSEMRDIPGTPNLSLWHMGRRFSSMPLLNNEFIGHLNQVTSTQLPEFFRPFAIQDRRPIIFHIGTKVTAIRPLPVTAEPGLLDHF